MIFTCRVQTCYYPSVIARFICMLFLLRELVLMVDFVIVFTQNGARKFTNTIEVVSLVFFLM